MGAAGAEGDGMSGDTWKQIKQDASVWDVVAWAARNGTTIENAAAVYTAVYTESVAGHEETPAM